MNPIKVLLVEDDPVWNECLTRFLKRENDVLLLSSPTTKRDAVELCRWLDLDVVLMDIMLQEERFGGIEAALDILYIQPTRVIMLTSLDEREVILESFAAGAVNYIMKSHYTEIPTAIREACLDHTAIHPDAAAVLRDEYARMKREELESRLTSTEMEVLGLLAEGQTHSVIQQKLFVTESTIKKHIHKILRKFGVKSSREAVEKAKKRRIL